MGKGLLLIPELFRDLHERVQRLEATMPKRNIPVRIVLEQHDGAKYKVLELTGILEPTVGTLLTKPETQALIDAGHTVIVKPRK